VPFGYGRNSKVLHAWTRGQINLAPMSEDNNDVLALSCGKLRIPTLSDTCSNSCRTAVPICIGHRSGPVGQFPERSDALRES